MGGRRGGIRGCQAIYTPGSGPLKKTGRHNDDYDQEGSQGNLSTSSIQNRLKPSHFNTIHSSMKNSAHSLYQVDNELTKKLNNTHMNYSQTPKNNSQNCGKAHHMDGDSRQRFKKPEQRLYLAKKIQDTRESEQDTINSPSTQIGWNGAEDRGENSDQRWEAQSNCNKKNDNPHRDNRGGRQCGGTSSNHNSRDSNINKDDHTKRYLSNRKIRNSTESEDNWRPKSSASNRNYDNRRESEIFRNTRQGSEPPNNILVSNNVIDTSQIRTRDTRSVEPIGFDKFQRKPPTGRRGYSKGNSINIDALPPRLQRKYLAEIGIDMPLPTKGHAEESYNTYSTQPSSNVLYNSQIIQQSQSNLMHNNLPPSSQVPDSISLSSQPPPQWSNTIPIRSRGRGRFRPEELEGPIMRPGTPDQYSAPHSRSNTPNQEFINRSYRQGCDSTMCPSIENLSRIDNMLMPPPPLPPQSFVSLANQISNTNKNLSLDNSRPLISPTLIQNRTQRENNSSNVTKDTALDKEGNLQTSVSPSKSEPFGSLPDISSGLLDWSEDVELSEKMENERLSRSSSVLSLRDNSTVSGSQLLGSDCGRNRSTYKKKCDKKRIADHSNSREKSHENSRERKKNLHNRENGNFNNTQINSINKRFDNRRGRNIRHPSRESSRDRGHNDDVSKSRSDIADNWRTGKRISICESDDGRSNCLSSHSLSVAITNSNAPPGVLILPDPTQSSPMSTSRQSPQQRKTLFDPNNPNKPIIVPSSEYRSSLSNEVQPQISTIVSGTLGPSQFQQSLQLDGAPMHYIADQMNNVRPSWYDLCVDSVRSPKNMCLLMGIEQVDRELQFLLSSGGLTANWDRVTFLRQSLQQSLQDLLVSDIKFCQAENVEQHFWKILFYNIIEMVRKVMSKEGPESREVCKKIMLKVIDDGTVYFENLLAILESAYKFKLDVFLSLSLPPKGLGFVGLALISAQKIFLFLGDLARYKEQANETANYGKSRQWYMKAQQINPKNGRPYNQLALLAHYARRKLDAVYYYMRSLMASNPFHSARESLIGLFDENRKKYESTERKRKEEREWRERVRMKEKEGANNIAGGLRREIWIHPGGRRMRRTTSTASSIESKLILSDLEELLQLSSVEVNKRFVTSYLHVHGKLITKIGMETFQEAAIQMLREFRALLQHSPLPLPGTRLLQLLALNMFAIETTQLKDCQMEQGYRSEIQERALIVSLQMFNLILERGVALLKKQIENDEKTRLVVDEDMQVLLPAIKIWCDWMLCHSTVWNPPPSCIDYRVGPPGDAWSRLATMVNLLEKLPTYQRKILIHGKEVLGRETELDLVRLLEDTTLSGFTPLMSNPQDAFYAAKTDDMEVAQVCLRIYKILFFGQVFLCGLEMPVLKLQKNESGISEYVSLVETLSTSSPNSPLEQSDSELLVDSYSEDEDESAVVFSKRLSNDSSAGSEIRSLIERKEELERRQRRQERHRERVQAILQKSSVSVEIEVRPRQLVPDTNCFIDYLPQLQCITKAISGTQPFFTLMVPLVVLNELEGLTRGADARDYPPASRAALNPEHIARVAASAKEALTFARSRNPAVRCLTTRGTVLSSSTFTVEEDVTIDGLVSNDDKILATCLSLFKTTNKDQAIIEEGQPRRLRRDVVLLTEDRNLRVKALARDVPVREVPDFMQWADLG